MIPLLCFALSLIILFGGMILSLLATTYLVSEGKLPIAACCGICLFILTVFLSFSTLGIGRDYIPIDDRHVESMTIGELKQILKDKP